MKGWKNKHLTVGDVSNLRKISWTFVTSQRAFFFFFSRMRVHFLKTGASKMNKGEFKGELAKRLEHESWDLGLGPALKLQMDQ